MKWFFQTKTNTEGSVCQYKVKSLCKGFMQREGIDCVETFAHVAKCPLRKFLSIAAY